MTRIVRFGFRNECRKRTVAAAVDAALAPYRRTFAILSTATLMMAGSNVFGEETSTPPAAQRPEEPLSLGEVVVTAQRRTQTVQDIPYNISVIGGGDIAKSGATSINDLARIVNGLMTVDQGPAARAFQNDLTLRGLRTDAPGGGTSETYAATRTVNSVSTYFGETPIFFPMVLEDIDRVEVLRGPQGTLYGSGAEGGTIRVIPHQPDFTALAGEVDVTGSYTEFANRPNENLHGVLNVPFSDTLALRLVAGIEHLAGFINAPNLWELGADGTPVPSVPGNLSSGPTIGPVQKGVNSSNQAFERLALRWKPAETLEVRFDYLHQTTTQEDAQVSTPFWRGGCLDYSGASAAASTPSCSGAPPSAFYANSGGPYTTAAYYKEPYRDTVDLGSLVATADLGFASLTSATSYDQDRTFNSVNVLPATLNIGGLNYNSFPPYNSYPRANFIAMVPATDRSFVQELRLASSGKNLFDYVVGGFYQRETRGGTGQIFASGQNAYNASISQPTSVYGDLASQRNDSSVYSDKAVFGELTAHVTDAWQLTGGFRYYRDAYSLDSVSELPMCGVVCSYDFVNPAGLTVVNSDQDYSGHLKKFNTSYDFGPNTKVYATYSEGFRRGGTNGLPVVGPFASQPQYLTFTPDFAKNYEAGIKGALLGRRVHYSAAIYRVNLTNFQFNSYSASSFPATFNGNSARSQGLEFEMQVAAAENLTLSAGYTYTDAKTSAAVTKLDLASFALVPSFGGTGPGETTTIVHIPEGVRLPGVSLNTAVVSADYTTTAGLFGQNGWTVLLHADAAYHSSAPGNIDDTSRFYWKIPSSVITNARLSLDVDPHLGFDLFAKNLTSNTAYSGASYVQTISTPYQLRNVARPRTVGLALRYRF